MSYGGDKRPLSVQQQAQPDLASIRTNIGMFWTVANPGTLSQLQLQQYRAYHQRLRDYRECVKSQQLNSK